MFVFSGCVVLIVILVPIRNESIEKDPWTSVSEIRGRGAQAQGFPLAQQSDMNGLPSFTETRIPAYTCIHRQTLSHLDLSTRQSNKMVPDAEYRDVTRHNDAQARCFLS